jgi:hypothetical protein
MIVSTEDFTFLCRLQLEVVAQFEHSLCFAQTKDSSFFERSKPIIVTLADHKNPKQEGSTESLWNCLP